MSNSPKVKLYFDIVSPFAYLAFWALENLPTFNNVEKTYAPIFLGGLMKLCNNRAPIEITNKAQWINVERLRWAKLFNIPMQEDMPDGFPVLTVQTQRVLIALQQDTPGKLPACIQALYHAFFVKHLKISEPAVIASVLGEVLPKEQVQSLLEAAKTPAIKEKLTSTTQAAFDEGAFGMPWLVATNSKGETQSFWGFDHLGQMADFLGVDKPTHGGWRAVL